MHEVCLLVSEVRLLKKKERKREEKNKKMKRRVKMALVSVFNIHGEEEEVSEIVRVSRIRKTPAYLNSITHLYKENQREEK